METTSIQDWEKGHEDQSYVLPWKVDISCLDLWGFSFLCIHATVALRRCPRGHRFEKSTSPARQQTTCKQFASHQTTPHDCFFFPSDQLKAASSTHTGDTAPIEAGQLFFTVHQIYYAPSIEPLLFSSLLSRQTPVLSHCFSALLIAGVCDSYL